MKPIELSVIIVNYQSWKHLEDCLNSFREYPPSVSYEIIIVDNDSQDDQFDSFKLSHPEIKLIKNKGNYGFSHGCNLGSAEAKGEYLLFLNPDTELTENRAIDTMLEYLQNHSDIGITSCRNVTPDGIGKEQRFLNPWFLFGFFRSFYRKIYHKEINASFPKDSNVFFPEWVTGSVVMIKKQLFNQVGRWNEDRFWMYSEDPDICYRVKKQGKGIALLTNVTILHEEGGASKPSVISSVRYKTEDTISKHNYIQEHSKGFSRACLHFFYFLKMQTYILVIIINIPIFWKDKFKIKTLVYINCWKYYLQAFKRKTWKNPRLKDI